jgi:hypothetical protein
MRDIDNQLARAKELLATVRHAAMATVNEDGSPHNTPYFFMCSADLQHLYWGSHLQSEHSRNVLRTGQLYVVLYDAMERGGLFIRADDARIAEGDELTEALAEHNRRRALRGWDALPGEYHEAASPQRMWIATARQFWVNGTERGADGRIIRDIRTEISREDLLGKGKNDG